jgi:O-acetyl-ADP-ribose deacetylase
LIAFDLPPITLDLADGDIAAETTDAIVNAANDALWMGAGVAGAIKARGGAQIESEAMAQGPIAVGSCVVTTAGRLAVPRFVIHAAVMGQDLQTSGSIIDRATRAALAAADRLEVPSVSMPAFGTGVGGFPIRECSRIMVGAIRDEARRLTTVRRIRLVLFGMSAYRSASEVACELLGRPLDGPDDCAISG